MPAIKTPRVVAQGVDLPMATPHTFQQDEESDNLSLHAVLASAIKIHEKVRAASYRFELENRRLHLELARAKQSMGLLDATPRPDSGPIPLAPVLGSLVHKDEHAHNNKSISNITNHTVVAEEKRVSTETRVSEERRVTVDSRISEREYDTSLWFDAGKMVHTTSEVGHASSLSEHYRLEQPTMVASRSISELQKEKAKKVHELRRKFNRLDRDDNGRVKSEWLEEMLGKSNRSGRNGRSRKSSRANNIHMLTCLDVIKAVNAFLGKSEEDTLMNYECFAEIMTQEDLYECFEPDVCEKILHIRDMFARDEMTQMVARFSHLETHDLSAAQHGKMKKSFPVSKYLDPASLAAILLNAIMMGVQTDVENTWSGWEVLEYFFTVFFLVELLIKLRMEGFEGVYFGRDYAWNCLDTVIVFVAVLDAILNILASSATSNIQLFTLLRLVRLARITRLVRLLRFKFFKELLLMIRGVFAGMKTLLWAIVLLALFVFMLGMMMRQTMGRWCMPEMRAQYPDVCIQPTLVKYGEVLFSSLPRSCLTVFRCFTDGCAAPDGTPLMVHVYEDSNLGSLIVMVYVISFLFVTFGLFNLIMAIFVENTMESAKYDERKRQQLRHMQAIHVAQKLQRLVLKFCKASAPTGSAIGLDDSSLAHGALRRCCCFIYDKLIGKRGTEIDETELLPVGLDVEISRDTFSRVVADPHVEKLLDDLGVAVTDPMDLFDTLDADGSGSIDVGELIKGIMKLRGTAEKSDMVACLLAVRAMQRQMQVLQTKLLASQRTMRAGQEKVDSQMRLVDHCLHSLVPGYGDQKEMFMDKLISTKSAPPM